MGILNFFKKFKKETYIEKPEEEKINFSEIPNFIIKKESELKEKEKLAIKEVDERIKTFTKNILPKIVNLENVNVKSKKSEERLKPIVIKSRKEYINFLNEFIESLNNLKKENLHEFNLNIDKLFSNFAKSTSNNYERTTLLIGKEMTEIKKEIRSLSVDLLKILQENKEITLSSKKLSTINLDLEKIKELKGNIKKIEKEMEEIEKEKTKQLEENKRITSEINKIKESNEYREYLEKKEKINSLEKEIKQKITSLKQKINFKALANFFHVFENKMNLVKTYKEDFPKSFEKDNGKDILDLLKESKLDEESIIKEFKEINDLKEKRKELISELKGNNLEELSKKNEKIEFDIIHLDSERNKKEKKLEEFEITKKNLIEKIKGKLEEFNTEIISSSISISKE